MSDETDDPKALAGADGGDEQEQQNTPPQLAVLGQYIKDLSFENPNAPASFQAKEQPKIDVAVDLRANRMAEEVFEIDLKFSAKATQGEKVAFVAELVYTGLFGIKNVPADQLEAVCLIECPRMLFPFARRVLADTTRDGGFPPLMLDPIDFVGLYEQRIAERQEKGEDAGDAATITVAEDTNSKNNGGTN
jgi:preprotein translocase subunit SecB